MFFEAQSLKYLFSTMQDVPRLATVIQLLFIIPMALYQGIIIYQDNRCWQKRARNEKERKRKTEEAES